MMTAERINFATHEEWLAYKESRIGGSSIATLLGLNKYETPYQLWEKMTGKVPPFEGNDATDRGHILEPAIAHWITNKLDWTILPSSTGSYVYQHPEFPFIIGSPDREAAKFITPDHAAFEKKIIEIKTTRAQITPDTVPDSWIVQVNHYMGLSGIHSGVIAWLSGSLEFQYLEVEFNQELFDIGITAACNFMMERVYTNIAPEITTASDAAHAYPTHQDGKVIDATEAVVELVKEIAVLREMTKEQETNLKVKEEQLKMLMGDAEAINYMGEKLATFKFQKGRKSFDAKALKIDHPQMYEQYEKEGGGYRVLRIYNA